MPNILIHSPYSDKTGQGNAVTADRLASILAKSGYQTNHSTGVYEGEKADAMIALNARKSAHAIARFRYLHPSSPLVIILTGTDINHPDVIDDKSATFIAMKLAHRLVVLHKKSLQQVPQKFRGKTKVIHPSVTLPDALTHHPEQNAFSIIMAGNMRQEKNPSLAVAASLEIPDDLKIHLYGNYSDASPGRIITHGSIPHQEMLTTMSQAHLLLNTSVQEGGANAICEAISIGLPVVASAIPGNIGLLGDDYAGLYTSDNPKQLARMLTKIAAEPELYAQLKNQVAKRAPLFTYATEAKAWTELLSFQLSH